MWIGCLMERDVWMGSIADSINDKKLSEIVLPGTHDSGSYCINAKSKRTDLLPDLGKCLNPVVDVVGAVWSKTQDFSIEDQLKMGVRYIDIRVYLDVSTFYLVHGLEAAPAYEEIAAIGRFVDSHPSEIVILDMNHIYKCNDGDICTLLNRFDETFGDKLCPPSPKGTGVPTYRELVQSGKTVIVAVTEKPEMFKSSFKHRMLCTQYKWVWSSETHVISPWGNTTDTGTLKKYLEDTMKGPRPANSLHVTQTILTPKMKDTISGLFRPPRNLKQLADQLTPLLPSWFEEFSDINLNIAIVDFLTIDLIDQLINLNVTGSGAGASGAAAKMKSEADNPPTYKTALLG